MAKAGLLFVGTDDGVVLYSEPGAAGRWIRIGQELRGTAISAVWTCSDDPTIVLAATEKALLRSTDGGALWEPIAGVAGGLLAGSKADPFVVYCLAPDGKISRSSDAGATWMQVGLVPVAAASVFIAAPDDKAALYAAAGAQIWSSGDSAASWAMPGELPGVVTGLAVLPGHAGVYASAKGLLYKYDAEQWQPITNAQPVAGPLAILAGRETTLLAALASGEIGRSSDDGATWEGTGSEIDWGTGLQALVVAPYHMDIAFAGGGPSVALSVDRGRTWQRLKGDSTQVRAIAVARLV
ncbi:MAG: hypothetical protein SH847_23820 [Roseiflexaceae bacterium]|nr:hypothetical protein [Roseiflexaceae bacterium]